MPPESWSGNWFAESSRPTRLQDLLARARAAPPCRMPWISSPNATLSITRRCASSPKCWKTIDDVWRRRSPQLRLARRGHVLAGDLDRARRSARSGGSACARASTCRSRRGPSRRTPRPARPRTRRRGRRRRSRVFSRSSARGRSASGVPIDSVGVAAEDLPDAFGADQRLAAAVDLVPGGDGAVGHRCHGSTLSRLSLETKIKRALRSCRLRRCRR